MTPSFITCNLLRTTPIVTGHGGASGRIHPRTASGRQTTLGGRQKRNTMQRQHRRDFGRGTVQEDVAGCLRPPEHYILTHGRLKRRGDEMR